MAATAIVVLSLAPDKYSLDFHVLISATPAEIALQHIPHLDSRHK